MSAAPQKNKRSFHFGRAASLCLLFAGGSPGCAATPNDPTSPDSGEVSLVEAVVTPLESLGVSGGAEICFNALDDNGNQLIDEGCGVPQGQIQVMLAWQAPGVDLDLYVTDPNGEIAVHQAATRSGLTRTSDCPDPESDCHVQNYEGVYLEEADALPGRYQVRVRLEERPAERSPLIANLSVRQPLATKAYRLEFSQEGQEALLTFEVAGEKKHADKKRSE